MLVIYYHQKLGWVKLRLWHTDPPLFGIILMPSSVSSQIFYNHLANIFWAPTLGLAPGCKEELVGSDPCSEGLRWGWKELGPWTSCCDIISWIILRDIAVTHRKGSSTSFGKRVRSSLIEQMLLDWLKPTRQQIKKRAGPSSLWCPSYLTGTDVQKVSV